jgi:hypothetical protein
MGLVMVAWVGPVVRATEVKVLAMSWSPPHFLGVVQAQGGGVRVVCRRRSSHHKCWLGTEFEKTGTPQAGGGDRIKEPKCFFTLPGSQQTAVKSQKSRSF